MKRKKKVRNGTRQGKNIFSHRFGDLKTFSRFGPQENIFHYHLVSLDVDENNSPLLITDEKEEEEEKKGFAWTETNKFSSQLCRTIRRAARPGNRAIRLDISPQSKSNEENLI
jgi:hypothetical protein